MMNIDWIRQAKKDIESLSNSLQMANYDCTKMEHIILMDLIESTRNLEVKIHQFDDAAK